MQALAAGLAEGGTESGLIPWASGVGDKGLSLFGNLKQNLKAEQVAVMQMNMDFVHKAGGVLRTGTRPMLNILLLLLASV